MLDLKLLDLSIMNLAAMDLSFVKSIVDSKMFLFFFCFGMLHLFWFVCKADVAILS